MQHIRPVVCLGLAAACCVLTTTAYAATIIYRTDSDLIRLADRIVRGVVTDVGVEEENGLVRAIVTLDVLEDFTGHTDGAVEIRELGGVANGRFLRVDGTPTYRVGEEIVVLLERSRRGHLRSLALGVTKFNVTRDGAGSEATLLRTLDGLAFAGGSVVDRAIGLTWFRAETERIRGVRSVRREHKSLETSLTPVAEPFTLLLFGNGLPGRWTEADSGTPVRWYRDVNAPSPLITGSDSTAEIQTALSAWSGQSGSSLGLTYSGGTSQGTTGPWASLGGSGAGVIFYEDPDDEISGSVLAIGGGGGTIGNGGTVNGTTFNRFTWGFVIVQNAVDLPPAFRQTLDFTRVVQHEIGHSIGLGHTDLAGNIMYPSCCSDSTPRPPALGADDASGLTFVYPAERGCAFSVTPAGHQLGSSGGTVAFDVSTDAGCSWSVSGLPSWATASGALPRTGSGTLSLAVAANTHSALRTAAPVIASRTVTLSQAGRAATAPTDFNGDGLMDLLWYHRTTGSFSAWLMNGFNLIDGRLFSPGQVADLNWRLVGSGDLDGDGQQDLVWQNVADGRVAGWLMTGLSLRQGDAFSIPQVADPNWRIVSVGDADGDGRADLYWQHQTDGRISVWLMQGLTVRAGTLLSPSQVADTSWRIAATADFDGDGHRDLLWHNSLDGRISIWRMNGLQQIAGTLTNPSQVADLTWQIRGAGDLNGDGYADIIWQNVSDGRISVWLMRGLQLIEGRLLNPAQVPDTNWQIAGPR